MVVLVTISNFWRLHAEGNGDDDDDADGMLAAQYENLLFNKRFHIKNKHKTNFREKQNKVMHNLHNSFGFQNWNTALQPAP